MSEFALKTALPAYLREEQNRIEKLAAGAGLDFFPTVFEILTYDQMNEIAAYGGFPNRYPHWRFGMEYERLAEELRVRPLEDLRDGHQQQPVVRVPARRQLARRSEARSWPTCTATSTSSRTTTASRSSDLDTGGRTVDPVKRPSTYDPNRRWIDKMANHGARIRRVVGRHGINRASRSSSTTV